MKTVSLIYGYSPRNAGDMAITLGAIDILKASGYDIKLFSRYQRSQKDFKDAETILHLRYGKDFKIHESPFFLDRSEKMKSSIRHYIDNAAIILGIKKNKSFCRNLIDSDYVIFNGGNLFRCSSIIDYIRLLALLYPLKIAYKANIPFLIFPQSASKLNIFGRNLLFPIIKKANILFFRERESYQYINSFISNSNFIQTIDLAFFINKNDLPTIERKKKIALTLRFHSVGDIEYLSNDEINAVFNTFSNYISALKPYYQFIIVVQSEKDKEKSYQFAKTHNCEIIQNNNPIELLQIYKSVSLLIGMRLHSIILALSVGTPCFGVFYKQWGLKNPGMMKTFNMPYKMLDESTDTATNTINDIDKIQKLLSNSEIISKEINSRINQEYEKLLNLMPK